MRISTLRAAHISGENRTDSVRFCVGRNATRSTVRPRSAHGYHFQRLVRVLSSGAGSIECRGRYVDDRVRFGHQSVSSDSDDFDSTDNAFGATLSRFDICTDYASGLYIEFPDRHPGVDGWDGGLHIVRKRDDREYDFDNTESECDDTE